ncbi:MAG TPA: DUF4395 family protein [Patescibacteria group bacterium]|nr:DUF4395 family protein [Patescibacteria group bacterium]
MNSCLVRPRLRAYWGAIGLLLLLIVFTKFIPLLFLIFLVNAVAMLMTEQFALFTGVYRRIDQKDQEENVPPADTSELRFLYTLATVFTGVALVLQYLGYSTLAMGIVLMCVVIFLLAAAGFCLGTIMYIGLKKLLRKT